MEDLKCFILSEFILEYFIMYTSKLNYHFTMNYELSWTIITIIYHIPHDIYREIWEEFCK